MAELADWLGRWRGIVVVDAGTGSPPPELYSAAHRKVLVTEAAHADCTATRRDLPHLIVPPPEPDNDTG